MKWALIAGGLLVATPALADSACEALQLQQALALVPMSNCNPAPRRPVPAGAHADVTTLEARIQALEHRLNLLEAQHMAEQNR